MAREHTADSFDKAVWLICTSVYSVWVGVRIVLLIAIDYGWFYQLLVGMSLMLFLASGVVGFGELIAALVKKKRPSYLLCLGFVADSVFFLTILVSAREFALRLPKLALLLASVVVLLLLVISLYTQLNRIIHEEAQPAA
jgi:hypothetical protein